MKNITEILTEALNRNKWEAAGCPVMYSIYGNVEGPWYFGYTEQEQVGKQMGVWSTERAYSEWAKIVVPFDQFDAYKLSNNLKYNLIK